MLVQIKNYDELLQLNEIISHKIINIKKFNWHHFIDEDGFAVIKIKDNTFLFTQEREGFITFEEWFLIHSLNK